jgi:hypothetical protein
VLKHAIATGPQFAVSQLPSVAPLALPAAVPSEAGVGFDGADGGSAACGRSERPSGRTVMMIATVAAAAALVVSAAMIGSLHPRAAAASRSAVVVSELTAAAHRPRTKAERVAAPDAPSAPSGRKQRRAFHAPASRGASGDAAAPTPGGAAPAKGTGKLLDNADPWVTDHKP